MLQKWIFTSNFTFNRLDQLFHEIYHIHHRFRHNQTESIKVFHYSFSFLWYFNQKFNFKKNIVYRNVHSSLNQFGFECSYEKFEIKFYFHCEKSQKLVPCISNEKIHQSNSLIHNENISSYPTYLHEARHQAEWTSFQ